MAVPLPDVLWGWHHMHPSAKYRAGRAAISRTSTLSTKSTTSHHVRHSARHSTIYAAAATTSSSSCSTIYAISCSITCTSCMQRSGGRIRISTATQQLAQQQPTAL